MSRTVRLPLVLVVLVAAVSLGLLLGTRLAWGKVPLTVEPGVAVLHDRVEGFTSFDGEDGTQFAFHADSVVWAADGRKGAGEVPPCLRQGKEVLVDVGYRWMRLPDGGARPFVLWVRC